MQGRFLTGAMARFDSICRPLNQFASSVMATSQPQQNNEPAIQWHQQTLEVALGRPPHVPGNPVNIPLSASSTFCHFSHRDYARDGSDTVAAFETALGALEHGTAIAFGSGLAAVAAIVEGLPAGAKVVMPKTLYSGVADLMTEQARLGKVKLVEADVTDTQAVVDALGAAADLLWTESASNPLLGVPDLPALVSAGHAAGATVVVDATFCTPCLQRPLDLGADISMHSVTKFIGGHSDLLMGAIVAKDPALAKRVLRRRYITGALPGTLEAFLALRGLRTLSLRMERHEANAREIAQRLDAHPAVEKVLYPGLTSHPGHERALTQQTGFGSMMSFLVHGGGPAAETLVTSLKLITHATSLGGVESLIERRATYPIDAARGSPPNLVRLSVGIEHVDDIWRDLAAGLTASQMQTG